MVGIMPGMADSTAIEAGPGSIGSAIEGREGEQLCRRCLGIGHHVLVLDRQNTRSKFALPEHHQILVSGVMGGDVQKIVGKGIGGLLALEIDRQAVVEGIAPAEDDLGRGQGLTDQAQEQHVLR